MYGTRSIGRCSVREPTITVTDKILKLVFLKERKICQRMNTRKWWFYPGLFVFWAFSKIIRKHSQLWDVLDIIWQQIYALPKTPISKFYFHYVSSRDCCCWNPNATPKRHIHVFILHVQIIDESTHKAKERGLS